MSRRGFIIKDDSIDSLCEYQEHQTTPKTPRSPNVYGIRLDYFDKSRKGKYNRHSKLILLASTERTIHQNSANFRF